MYLPQHHYVCLPPNSHQHKPASSSLVLEINPVPTAQMAVTLLCDFPDPAASDPFLLHYFGCLCSLAPAGHQAFSSVPSSVCLIPRLPDYLLVPALCPFSSVPLFWDHNAPRPNSSFFAGSSKILLSVWISFAEVGSGERPRCHPDS